jgi:hypothetical protein
LHDVRRRRPARGWIPREADGALRFGRRCRPEHTGEGPQCARDAQCPRGPAGWDVPPRAVTASRSDPGREAEESGRHVVWSRGPGWPPPRFSKDCADRSRGAPATEIRRNARKPHGRQSPRSLEPTSVSGYGRKDLHVHEPKRRDPVT